MVHSQAVKNQHVLDEVDRELKTVTWTEPAEVSRYAANTWSREGTTRVRKLEQTLDGLLSTLSASAHRGIDFLIRRGRFWAGVNSITLFRHHSRVMSYSTQTQKR